MVLLDEYFHGGNASSLGPSRESGGTGRVAKLLPQSGGAQ